MKKEHIIAPSAGDIIYLNLNPTIGHEQGGNRPIVVLTHQRFNQRNHLAICVPITSKQKGYTTEVEIKVGKVSGCILCNQVKSVDWAARGYTVIGVLTEEELVNVREIVTLLINPEE